MQASVSRLIVETKKKACKEPSSDSVPAMRSYAFIQNEVLDFMDPANCNLICPGSVGQIFIFCAHFTSNKFCKLF